MENIMLVLAHILIAFSSVVYTTYLYFAPSQRKFYINYGLMGLTVVSGTYLVIASHARLVSACMTGLAYLAVVSLGSALAHARLVRAEVRTSRTK